MYALAAGLVGFASSTLRVRVEREEGPYVWVVTADLQDAGTRLTLDREQLVAREEEVTTYTLRHQSGLVTFEA